MNIFLFIAAILSIIATAAIIHIVCRHAKLKALITGIAFQPIKQTEAVFGNDREQCTMVYNNSINLNDYRSHNFYFCNHTEMQNIQKKLYSNTVTVMLFFSDIKQYVPVLIM